MAIYLSDPRQQALENAVANYVGYRQRKSQQEKDLNNFKTANSIINNAYNTQVSPDSSGFVEQAAGQVTGINGLVGKDGRQIIRDAKQAYTDADNQYNALKGQYDSATDDGIRQKLFADLNALQARKGAAHAQAESARGWLGGKGASLVGYGANDDIDASTKANNDFFEGLKNAQLPNAGQQFFPNPQETTSDNLGTGLLGPSVQNYANGAAGAGNSGSGLFGPKFNSGNNARSAVGADLMNQAAQGAMNDYNGQYQLAASDLAADPRIAEAAQKLAYQSAREKFNPDTFSASIIQQLLDANINPETIGKVNPLIEKYAKNIATQYVSDDIRKGYANGGDMRGAALTGLNLLGPEFLKVTDAFAPQSSGSTLNQGDRYGFFQTTTNPFGGGLSVNKLDSVPINMAPGTKAQLAQNDKHFNANLGQHQYEFGVNAAQQDRRIGLEEMRTSLAIQTYKDTNKPAALRNKALNDAIDSQGKVIDAIQKRIMAINPMGAKNDDPEVQQLMLDLTTAQYRLNRLTDEQLVGLGIVQPGQVLENVGRQQSGKIPLTGEEYNKRYEALRRKGHSDEAVREWLETNY